MSGGSYNYLYCKEIDDLICCGLPHPDLRVMADDLKAHFPGTKAAKETDELIRLLRLYCEEIDRRRKRLEEIWHAMEWWQSGDYGKDAVEKRVQALEDQRIGSGL